MSSSGTSRMVKPSMREVEEARDSPLLVRKWREEEQRVYHQQGGFPRIRRKGYYDPEEDRYNHLGALQVFFENHRIPFGGTFR